MKKLTLFLAACLLFSATAGFAQATSGETPLERGWKAYKSAEYTKALEAAREARVASPADPSAAELWGRAALATGDPAKAAAALGALTSQRGTVQDYRLLATAFAMSGRQREAEGALAKAESGKSPTPEALYALAWQKPDAAGRLALMKRIASEFPATGGALAPEIAYWEQKTGAVLRSPAQPLPAEGFAIKLKTLFGVEWAVCTTATGEELWLMVDTAARTTVLSKDTAGRLKLTPVQAAYPVAGAYANEPAPAYTLLDSLDFGGYKVQNVPAVVVADAPGTLNYREGRGVLKGILGMDLLRGLKVRFDRQKNVLKVLPPGAPLEALLDGKPSEWTEFPAFPVGDQLLVPSSLGTKAPVLGLLATGCAFVMACEPALPGSGLSADSRNTVNLSFGTLAGPASPAANLGPGMSTGANTTPQAAPGVAQANPQVLGWIEQCVPTPGNVRTVPKGATVGMGAARFEIRDLPLYPTPLGGDVPASIVVGRKITDFFAFALDLSAGKAYTKQVLFAK